MTYNGVACFLFIAFGKISVVIYCLQSVLFDSVENSAPVNFSFLLCNLTFFANPFQVCKVIRVKFWCQVDSLALVLFSCLHWWVTFPSKAFKCVLIVFIHIFCTNISLLCTYAWCIIFVAVMVTIVLNTFSIWLPGLFLHVSAIFSVFRPCCESLFYSLLAVECYICTTNVKTLTVVLG